MINQTRETWYNRHMDIESQEQHDDMVQSLLAFFVAYGLYQQRGPRRDILDTLKAAYENAETKVNLNGALL